MEKPHVSLYDTTLRDGTQGEGISLSVEDKLKITRLLDRLGVHYVEGGWPGSNPKDAAYFRRVQGLKLEQIQVAAFGSTCRVGSQPQDDANIQALIATNTPAVALFGKSWDLHVHQVLNTTLEENLHMIADSVRYLKAKGREVFFDAEHFFDGYEANPAYALQALSVAAEAGAGDASKAKNDIATVNPRNMTLRHIDPMTRNTVSDSLYCQTRQSVIYPR